VVIPRYASIDLKNARRVYDRLAIHFGPAQYDISIYQAPAEFPLYLVDCPRSTNAKGSTANLGVGLPG